MLVCIKFWTVLRKQIWGEVAEHKLSEFSQCSIAHMCLIFFFFT